jgi:hypothetical protein
MSAGFAVTKDSVNNRAGSLVLTLRQCFDDINNFNGFLNQASTTDASLTTLGMTQAEVTTLRNSFADLAKLVQVGRAAAVQAAPSDFFANAKQLLGPN